MAADAPPEFHTDLVEALGALSELHRDRTANVKTKTGADYSYAYADLASVCTAVRPVLAAHHLAVMQPVTGDDATVSVETVLLHTSGAELRFPPLSMPRGATPQETGSAITYARRYTLLAALGLATEDDDGAAASTTRRPPKERRPSQSATGVKQQVLDLFNGDRELASEAWQIARETLGVTAPDNDLTPKQLRELLEVATPPPDEAP